MNQHFEFGENGRPYLSVLNDMRIGAAENRLRNTLGVEPLAGKRFLDTGSGSSLFFEGVV